MLKLEPNQLDPFTGVTGLKCLPGNPQLRTTKVNFSKCFVTLFVPCIKSYSTNEDFVDSLSKTSRFNKLICLVKINILLNVPVLLMYNFFRLVTVVYPHPRADRSHQFHLCH